MLEFVKGLNDLMWSFILIFLLCGTGIFFTFSLKFVQIRKFGQSFKRTFGGIFKKGNTDDGGMTSFQSLATAIAAQVGTGNLAGAATAIASGGPGAIFWMWLSAFFGMSTMFAEATLAQKFKTKVDGQITGGPAYYIEKGLGSKKLACFFSVTIILALGFIGNMVQSNSIGDAFNTAFGINPIIVGVVVAILSAFIFLGGVKRIASFTEKVVPIMALLYILGSLYILGNNLPAVGEAFKMIFVGAFSPQALFGGAMGIGVKESVRYGVARGLFSNEAGMGSTPHAHAVAKVKHPIEQAMVSMVGVFIDTFVILTLTALVIISSGALTYTDGVPSFTGIALTQQAFVNGMGNFGMQFIAIALLFFAFSTIIGWYFFGEINAKYLFGKKGVAVYKIIVLICIVLGSAIKVDLVWELADTFNGFMVFPNLIAVLALAKIVKSTMKEYENGEIDIDLDK